MVLWERSWPTVHRLRFTKVLVLFVVLSCVFLIVLNQTRSKKLLMPHIWYQIEQAQRFKQAHNNFNFTSNTPCPSMTTMEVLIKMWNGHKMPYMAQWNNTSKGHQTTISHLQSVCCHLSINLDFFFSFTKLWCWFYLVGGSLVIRF